MQIDNACKYLIDQLIIKNSKLKHGAKVQAIIKYTVIRECIVQHLLFVSQCTLYFFHVTQNIKQISKDLGLCGVFEFWEFRAMKFKNKDIDQSFLSLWLTIVESLFPELCSLSS